MRKMIVYSDPHLSSNKHGSHRDYPNESLECFKKMVDVVEEVRPELIVGLGDLTFGRFNSIEYRLEVEEQLRRISDVGTHVMLKGNHDERTDGMTEYDYYLIRNAFLPAQEITINGFLIQMFNWGEPISIKDETSIVMVHDYVRYTDTKLPMYGNKYINLDNINIPNSLEYIIAGHIHGQHMFGRGQFNEKPIVHYMGCNARPSYIHGNMQEKGQVVLVTFENKELGDSETKITYEIIDIPLLSLDESFNLDEIASKDFAKMEKANRVDLSGIVEELNNHERVSGDPDMIVDSLTVDDKYKNKAKEYLSKAL